MSALAFTCRLVVATRGSLHATAQHIHDGKGDTKGLHLAKVALQLGAVTEVLETDIVACQVVVRGLLGVRAVRGGWVGDGHGEWWRGRGRVVVMGAQSVIKYDGR